MKNFILVVSLAAILFSSCKDEKVIKVKKTEINGVVQKGPFLNGTSIGIYELNDDYFPTGKVYSSQIVDNSGTFQLKNVSLVSQYVQLKADGYYYNEITGQNSNSPITLYALSDIKNKASVNVNILSNLEKSRIEYLLSTGLSFAAAKKQAKQEILNIFSISKADISDFELLSISEDGEDNAILLAVSLIVQGYRTESELSELLANISTDIRQDGKLNSSSLGSLLINDARLLNLPQIRNNIETRYANLGMTVSIPNFEKHIQTFIDNTTYQFSKNIDYPEFSTYGENILYGEKTSFSDDWSSDWNLSLAANLPKGASLKIIIKGGLWSYEALPNKPVNWTISEYDFNLQQQTFTATESGKNCDLIISFEESGTYTIEYYENNSTIPTRTKTINIDVKYH
ncbi:MAG: hypothetical protein GX330_05100 [Bacteroidales bacterium]|nr:hypothetical protein [Bacteroidales bacterium]